MSEWKKVKLGEICKISAGGDKPSLVSEKETNHCQIPIYSNGIDNQGLYGFTDNAKIKGNAITITGRGANAGTVFYRETAYYPIIRLLSLVPNNDIINPRYLYYLIKDRTFLSTGSAQPQITVPNISNYEINYNTNLDIQHRIATILSRYDSLIENYQKQIRLLEESTQRLYKEWFIDLRFPSYENTKIVDGVPEGWEKKTIAEVCTMISSGSTPSRSIKGYWDKGTIRWVKTKELLDGWILDTEEYITQDGYNNSSTKLFPPNTILMAIYASPTLGRLGILSTECCCNQAALGLIADENAISWQWLFWKLYELRDEFNAIARGAGQQNISGIVVKNKEIVIPTRKIINWFTSVVSSMFEQQKNLTTQICHLTEARDRLLPKLMSGEIEV